VTKLYDKLVRDKIPEIIRQAGEEPKTRILNDAEYLDELVKKLGEEYDEFKADMSAEELADLQEVILALAEALHISREQLEHIRLDKVAKRGAFEHKIFLESTE
jgi:predicted house-cleaning noncanonical NTP pyrophosphatase (MazG superfamily)